MYSPQSHLGCWSGSKETVLLDVASPLGATITTEEEETAASKTRKTDRPGFTDFTDGSRLKNGATGYAVAWKQGQTWKGHKTYISWGHEAYDAECAAIARALQAAATSNHKLGTATIFSDAQAAIRRMSSDDPGPGQKSAIEARQQIAALRTREPQRPDRDQVVSKPPRH